MQERLDFSSVTLERRGVWDRYTMATGVHVRQAKSSPKHCHLGVLCSNVKTKKFPLACSWSGNSFVLFEGMEEVSVTKQGRAR